jgi:Domain of unknown function (DUF4160)
MPVVAKFCGIVIRLLCLGTLGMRLHAFYGDREMVLDLKSLRVLQEEVSEPVKRMVLAWARAHQGELMAGRFAARSSGTSVAYGGANTAVA